jgi:hypothetical protein
MPRHQIRQQVVERPTPTTPLARRARAQALRARLDRQIEGEEGRRRRAEELRRRFQRGML